MGFSNKINDKGGWSLGQQLKSTQYFAWWVWPNSHFLCMNLCSFLPSCVFLHSIPTLYKLSPLWNLFPRCAMHEEGLILLFVPSEILCVLLFSVTVKWKCYCLDLWHWEGCWLFEEFNIRVNTLMMNSIPSYTKHLIMPGKWMLYMLRFTECPIYWLRAKWKAWVDGLVKILAFHEPGSHICTLAYSSLKA